MRLVKAEEQALDGLYAHDIGATDSGLSDANLRARMVRRVGELSSSERWTAAQNLYGWPPYTSEEIEAFLRWMEELGS
jgi:hypothetical protein